MKVAYHFLSAHSSLGSGYGYQIEREVLQKVLARPAINMNTKVFIGDLLLDYYAKTREDTRSGHIARFNQEKYDTLFQEWVNPESPVWFRLPLEARKAAYRAAVFVMCFEMAFQNHIDMKFEGVSQIKLGDSAFDFATLRIMRVH